MLCFFSCAAQSVSLPMLRLASLGAVPHLSARALASACEDWLRTGFAPLHGQLRCLLRLHSFEICSLSISDLKLPGFEGDAWDKVLNLEALVEFGTISRADLDLFTVVDTVDEAYDIITTRLEAGAVDHPGIGL